MACKIPKSKSFKLLLFLIAVALFFGCENNFHSLGTNDTQKIMVDTLLVQSIEARNTDPFSIISLADSALVISREIQYEQGIFNSMYNKAIGHYFQNDFDEAEDWCKTIYDKGVVTKLDTLDLYKYLGSAHTLNGIIWQKKGDYEKAVQHFIGALNFFESNEDYNNIASAYTNISESFRFMKDYEKALDYNKKAEDYYRRTEMYDQLTTVFQNRGNIYNNQGKHAKALDVFKSTLDSANVHNDIGNTVHAFNNLGVSYEEMGRDDQAIDYYLRAMDIYKSRKDYWGEATALGNISMIFLKKGNFEEAIDYSKKGLDIAQQNDFKELILFSYENLARINEKMGRKNESLFILKNISALKDSLYNEEKYRTISNLEQKYEKEKSEKLIAQKDRELIQAQLNSKTLLIFVIVLGVIILLSVLIAFFLYKQVQLRKQKNLQLRQKNAIIENKNQEITKQRDEIKEQKEDLELLVNAYETQRKKEIQIGKRKIFINDIIYIKYQNRKSHIFLKDGRVIEQRVQLSQLASDLKYKSNFLFAQINQNYIINFNNVDISFFDGEDEKYYFTPFLENDLKEGRTEEFVKTRKRSGLDKNFEREYNRYLRLKHLLNQPRPSSNGSKAVPKQ